MEDYNDSYYLPYCVEGKDFSIGFLPKALDDYYNLSEAIFSEKDWKKKLELCHKQLEILPFWVKTELETSDSLSPVVACRDWGSKIYMYNGDWRSAEKFIQKCVLANAYYPNHGEAELQELYEYRKVAETTISFLEKNPGFLQKNIYKALSGIVSDISILKRFTRWSNQIRKEPFERTNRLFISE